MSNERAVQAAAAAIGTFACRIDPIPEEDAITCLDALASTTKALELNLGALVLLADAYQALLKVKEECDM